MTFRRTGRRVAGYLFRKMLRLSPSDASDLRGEAVDESLLEARRISWNAAAERYFQERRHLADQDARKPWMPDISSSRLVARLGWILSELIFGEHLVVLDFGCGLGWLTRLLHRLEFNVFGLDVSRTAVEYARRASARASGDMSPHFEHYLLTDGRTFPLSDASVHFIISHDAFHHVPCQQAVLEEMHRVLVPGGKLILSEPGAGHSAESATAEDVALYGVLEREVRIPDFEAKALRAGFREVYLKPCPVPSEEKWSRRSYRAFLRGVVQAESYLGLRRSMIANPMFVCEKAGDFRGSFHHRAELEVREHSLRSRPEEELRISVVLKNTGTLAFSSRRHDGGGYVTLALKVLGRGEASGFEPGGRFHLDQDLAPGASVEVDLRMAAPRQVGAYRLVIEPVYERFYWFSEKGSRPAEISLSVS